MLSIYLFINKWATEPLFFLFRFPTKFTCQSASGAIALNELTCAFQRSSDDAISCRTCLNVCVWCQLRPSPPRMKCNAQFFGLLAGMNDESCRMLLRHCCKPWVDIIHSVISTWLHHHHTGNRRPGAVTCRSCCVESNSTWQVNLVWGFGIMYVR